MFIVLISYLLVDFVPLFAFAEWVDNGFLLTGGQETEADSWCEGTLKAVTGVSFPPD